MFVPRGSPWPSSTIDRSLELRAEGLSTYEIARRLGVPRSSVGNWCRGNRPRGRTAVDRLRCPKCGGGVHGSLPRRTYAYLLGLYLGDGYLATPKTSRAVYLCFALDAKYTGIVDECRWAISTVLPRRKSSVTRYTHKRVALVRSYGREWLCLFPQHGPGRKHHRRITLEPWQQEIVARHPGNLLRGLIQSDGWRGLNRVHVKGKDYAYPRYQFSNRSSDIRTLFTAACETLGIEWRRWGPWHISIARQGSVAKLDRFVGPKA
jgi:hypothetical protein